ncbi:DUF2163 domain-containing protein [Sphingobium sp. MI1205]|uniref:DUF2163 domain-containing protein n=1 Tax=Sphingobium sp. MI1205 TaxID=407020 RepID=UPI00076FFCA1|nr:DUF2163 domain-containing protein [Sphingobium sp. MI1205]AMK19328.1 phage protein [Sphingobium sp. MI1205]
MSRTLSSGMNIMLAGRTHTRCRMLRLDLTDGTVMAFTDHNRSIDYDLGDGSASYSPAVGMFGSDVALSEGFDVDNFESTGPLGEIVTRIAVMGGRYDRARARLFEINWSTPADGEIAQLAGNVAEARMEGGKFTFGIRSQIDRYNQVIGRVISNLCSADHGDARCGRAVETVDGAIGVVTDAMRFQISFAGSFANDYFNAGKLVFTLGEMVGIKPVRIFDWTAAGAITLMEPLPTAPQVGDTVTLSRGCPKTRAGCMERDNIANARAFFEVPGSDQVLKVPVPGSAGA